MSDGEADPFLDRPKAKKKKKKKKKDKKPDINLTAEEMAEEGYEWDFVMVFQVFTDEDKLTPYQEEFNIRNIVTSLNHGGLQTKLYFSCQKDEVFCLVRCPLTRLKMEGDRIDYPLLLDSKKLAEQAELGNPDASIGQIKIKDLMEQSWRSPWENIYGKYDTDEELQHLYTKHGSKSIPFRSVDRLKLIMGIVEARSSQGGCGIDISKHTTLNSILGWYPLHESQEKQALRTLWLKTWSWPNSQVQSALTSRARTSHSQPTLATL
jgi:hypothetical protein